MTFECFINPQQGEPGIVVLPAGGYRRARADITAWPGYAPTPLIELAGVARAAAVARVVLKDEASRFGLGSVKALGGAYAVAGQLAMALARRGVAASATSGDLESGCYRDATAAITVACATDGNHGRSVAWGARRFGCACVIFVHEGVSRARIDAIAGYGAEVRRVAGTYDDSVRAIAGTAALEGWIVVSDTSWPGYTEIPRAIMQGYRLMPDEAADQWDGPPPTHAFIQAGVGGVAASVSVQLRARFNPTPRIVVVEPDRAACLFASACRGELTAVDGPLDTVMAGLACGEPSLLAWQELGRAAAAFLTIPDEAAIAAMRSLAECQVIAGESGAAGLAGFLQAAADPASRAVLGLDTGSVVLLFSTEGATDPALYAKLVGHPHL